MKWDIYKAKSWMLRCGMDHIENGLYAEGGELVFESKWGDGCNTQDFFIDTLKTVCLWSDDEIEDAIKEALK